MRIIAVGTNHKIAPLEIREKFYLQKIERELLLSALRNDPSVAEALVLSTCNRTEIYAHIIDTGRVDLVSALFKTKDIAPKDEERLRQYFYVYEDESAIRHLFSVSAGLDSLIVGEKQILGQVKTAAELSRQMGMSAKVFNILTNMAIRAGKKARHETDIDAGGASISWAVMKTAERLLGSLKDRSVLIVGAGKMGKLAINCFDGKGLKRLYVMNRNQEKADEVALHYGDVLAEPFWKLKDILADVDVCVCSTSCPHYLVEAGLAAQVMSGRRARQLIFIDISVPRNIDPAIAGLANVRLITTDHLTDVVQGNLKKRQAAAGKVEAIIETKLHDFYKKIIRRERPTYVQPGGDRPGKAAISGKESV